jgi:hypothetical protein
MRALWLCVGIAALCLFAGCGDDNESPKDVTPPTVVDTSPADQATDVSPYPVVEVWFSEAMDAATIDTLTFFVDGLHAHSVAYDEADHKATLCPATLAEADSEYDVHVESEVEDAAGNAMGEDVVFSFTTGAQDCVHLADRFEPNDVIAAATPVEVDVVYPGLTSCGGAERTDYYRFTLTDTAKVTVMTQTAWVDTEYVSWQINFRREDGDDYATLGTGVHWAGETKTYYYSFLPGTYWVEIGNNYEVSHIVLYNLTVATSAPATDDEYEDNDFVDQAKPVEPGLLENLRGAHVDADYFSIGLNEGETLTITVTESPAITDTRRIRITNAAGATRAGGSYQEGPVELSWTATETATHLILVEWWQDGIVYSLNVEVTP